MQRPSWLLWMADGGWLTFGVRYVIVAVTVGVQLLAYHMFLAAGQRRLQDVLPGVVLSVVLWILLANVFTRWLQVIGGVLR